MAFILSAGVLFWSCLALFGARKMFLEGTGPLVEPVRALEQKLPRLVPIVAIVGPLLALALVLHEVLSIYRVEGYAGVSFLFAVVCGVLGAIAIAARWSLDAS